MPSNGGLISHLTCLVYVPYLAKLKLCSLVILHGLVEIMFSPMPVFVR